MIGWLEGTARGTDIVLCGGVGYRVCVPGGLDDGATVSLAVTTVVRDNAIDLYGFTDPLEQEMFAALTRVTGVGPKVAVAMLSGLGWAGLARAITGADAKQVATVKGVGPKLAQTVCVQVKVPAEVTAALADQPGPAVPEVVAEADPVAEALVGLGFTPRVAADAAASARADGETDEPTLIRRALTAARAA